MNIIRYSFTFLFIIYYLFSSGQNTFSRFYDFDTGINDTPLTLLLEEEGFIVSADFSGDTSVVSSLVRFDNNGDVQASVIFPDFVLGSTESIIKQVDGYAITGNSWSLDENRARGNRLLLLDFDFNIKKDTTLFYQELFATNSRGIQKYENENLVYFQSVTTISNSINGIKGNILLIDNITDSVIQRIVMPIIDGPLYTDYDIRNPQTTTDGNFAFIATVNRMSEERMVELTKINREGEILKKVSVLQESFTNNTLVQDDSGNFYFATRETPIHLDTIIYGIERSGGISKLNADLDSVIWSLPFNRFDSPVDPRQRSYTTYGILPLRDGNFMAYGSADDIIQFKDLGFLVKFDKDGEILWSRFFEPTLTDGTIRESFFKDCKELPDGRLLCIGQSSNLPTGSLLGNEIWILMLDEEGCLEPGCTSDLIVTSTSSTPIALPAQTGRIYPNPVSNVLQIADVSFDRYEINDIMGRQVQAGSFTTEVALPSEMPKGMYVLQLIEDNNLKSVFKFLKE